MLEDLSTRVCDYMAVLAGTHAVHDTCSHYPLVYSAYDAEANYCTCYLLRLMQVCSADPMK